MNKKPFIVGVGGANMDVHIKTEKPYILRDSNPGRLFMSAGGVTRNILENLSLLGASCALVSAVSDDIFGRELILSCKNAGIDTGHIYKSESFASGTYLDLLDNTGDMFVAACDAHGLENMPVSFLEENRELLSSADAIVCDTNLTTKQLKTLLRLAEGVPVFIDPVSTSKAQRISALLGSFFLIKPNRIELSALSGMPCSSMEEIKQAAKALTDKGTKNVAVSLGSEGCLFVSEKDCFFSESKRARVVNASGAGDAFTAGAVFAFCKGLAPREIAAFANACGLLATESESTINPELSEEAALKIISNTF